MNDTFHFFLISLIVEPILKVDKSTSEILALTELTIALHIIKHTPLY